MIDAAKLVDNAQRHLESLFDAVGDARWAWGVVPTHYGQRGGIDVV